MIIMFLIVVKISSLEFGVSFIIWLCCLTAVMRAGVVGVEDRGNIRYVMFNRPDVYNALNTEMRSELLEILRDSDSDENVRVVVLTGTGPAFASGEDLRDLMKYYKVGERPNFKRILVEEYHPILMAIRDCRKPVIAAVNGVAAGAGMSLVLACDYKIASEDASFITAFIKIGLIPDTGMCFYLPRIVGLSKALELMLLSDRISAHQAKELGIVNEVVPSMEFRTRVEIVAKRFAELPPLGVTYTKKAINESLNLNLDKALELEAELQHLAGSTEDHLEGVKAFVEKRQPAFRGR